jgi:hypothetical protein
MFLKMRELGVNWSVRQFCTKAMTWVANVRSYRGNTRLLKTGEPQYKKSVQELYPSFLQSSLPETPSARADNVLQVCMCCRLGLVQLPPPTPCSRNQRACNLSTRPLLDAS